MKKTATWLAALCAALLALPVMGCKDELNSVAVESVALNTTTLTLAPGGTGKLTATVVPSDADDRTVKWSSSNTDVVMVDSNGTVGAISVGIATIMAQAGGKTAACLVTVKQESVAVERVTLDTTTLTIAPGGTRKLTATVLPSNADDTAVAWSSSNADVATVGTDGTVTAHAEGTATITAQSGGKTATCAVTVKPILIAVERVALSKETLTLTRGGTERLTATVLPSDAEDKTVAWSSSNADVVMVGNDGTVTAVKAGTATVTARAGDKEANCTVTVQEVTENPTPVAVENVALDATALTLARGTTRKLTATVLPSNADDTAVAWSSSDGTVATVDNDGTVTAVAKGRAIIIAQAGGKVAVCEVTVHIAVDQVTLDADTLTLVSDEARKLTATVLPNNADDKTVAWSSSDGTVATVDSDGTVTAVKVGTVTITASAGGKTAVCEVTVKFPDAGGFEIDEYGRLTKYSGTDATVVIPNGVTVIGSNAFEGCTGLTSVVIPDGVTEIGWYAFRNCTGLTSVVIPDSVTEIGWSVFYMCTKLSTVTYGGTKEQWKSIREKGSLNPTCVICTDGHLGVKDVPPYLTMSGTVVTGYTDGIPAELDIPDGVTEIGWGAFQYCTGLTSVDIPDSVTEIGSNAFHVCSSLTSVDIPDSVTKIGGSAFETCRNLTSVTIGNGVTSIGDSVFSGCTGLTRVDIPDSVTSIGNKAFFECESLESVTIGDGVTSIGQYAFSGCSSLTSVDIPDSVTSIGSRAFSGCNSLESVTIGDGVTSIGQYAFSGCSSLTSVDIPDSVTSIGSYAFEVCNSLESVTIPDGVTRIDEGTFLGCSSLASITIPDSVTSIYSSAFKSCSSLESVTIPDSVIYIGNEVFFYCTSLTSVDIPDSVTGIGWNAFNGCSSLTSVTIPNGVTKIESGAFCGCTSLTSVTIPNSVTSIYDNAFAGCTRLNTVTYNGTLAEWKDIDIDDKSGLSGKAITFTSL